MAKTKAAKKKKADAAAAAAAAAAAGVSGPGHPKASLPPIPRHGAVSRSQRRSSKRKAGMKPSVTVSTNSANSAKSRKAFDFVVPPGYARYTTFDVFTTEKYQGNTVAVVNTPLGLFSPKLRQKVAREFNYSETTFVTLGTNGRWGLDIFTPYEELRFAGHPIIGTICSLAIDNPNLEEGTIYVQAGCIDFFVVRSGGPNPTITATAKIPHAVHVHSTGLEDWLLEEQQPLLAANMAGLQRTHVWPVVSITKGMTYVLVEVPSMDALGQVKSTGVNVASMVSLDAGWAPSFVGTYFYCVTESLRSGSKLTIHSRMIEKDMGEDAVTGSAACALAAFLAMQVYRANSLRLVEFEITQGEHLGRKGTAIVEVALDDNGDVAIMKLQGSAVRIMGGIVDMSQET